jgi:hypothetical protein
MHSWHATHVEVLREHIQAVHERSGKQLEALQAANALLTQIRDQLRSQ